LPLLKFQPSYYRIRQVTGSNTMRCMRVACRKTKTTNTHTDYCLSTATVITWTRLSVLF